MCHESSHDTSSCIRFIHQEFNYLPNFHGISREVRNVSSKARNVFWNNKSAKSMREQGIELFCRNWQCPYNSSHCSVVFEHVNLENSVMKCNFNRMKLYEEISAFRL